MLSKDQVYEYWDNEYSKQLKSKFKNKKSIDESLKDIGGKVKAETDPKGEHANEYGQEVVDPRQTELVIKRFERIFGPLQDKESIQKLLREQDTDQNEEIYEMIEENYREVFRENMDRFMSMSFEEYCK